MKLRNKFVGIIIILVFSSSFANNINNREIQDSINVLCEKAKALGYSGNLSSAIKLFDKVLTIDSNNRRALMGKGKFLFWSGRNASAVKIYKQVLANNSNDKEAVIAIKKVSESMSFRGSVSLKMVEELENEKSLTKTILPIQEYSINKKIGDYLDFGLVTVFDNSERHYINDTIDLILSTRYLDNFILKSSYAYSKLKVYAHLGYSSSDSRFTTYGLAFNYKFKLNNLLLSNTINFGYDYFYHWNYVGKDYIGNTFNLKWKKINLNLSIQSASVRKLNVFVLSDNKIDTLWQEEVNPYIFISPNFSLNVLKISNLTLLAGMEYSDYKFGSFLYYTPHSRNVLYGGLRLNGNIKSFHYGATLKGGIDDGGNNRAGETLDSQTYYDIKANFGFDFGFMLFDFGAKIFENQNYNAKIIYVKFGL